MGSRNVGRQITAYRFRIWGRRDAHSTGIEPVFTFSLSRLFTHNFA